MAVAQTLLVAVLGTLTRGPGSVAVVLLDSSTTSAPCAQHVCKTGY